MSILNNVIRSKTPYASSNIYNVTASLTPNFSNLTMFERINKAREIIFAFDYPTPDNIDKEIYKEFFETLFITKYIDDYFKFETFERWQVALYSKLLEVLPTYNAKLSNFFYEDKEKLFFNKTITKSTQTQKSDNKNKDIASIYPSNLNKAGLSINNIDYANNGSVKEGESNNTTTAELETTTGNILDKAIEFDKHYNKIFSELVDEFACLFSFLIHY